MGSDAASLFAVQNITHAGDNFVCSTDIYGGTWNLFANTMNDFTVALPVWVLLGLAWSLRGSGHQPVGDLLPGIA